MLYCKNCQRLTEGPICGYCRNTKLRTPLDADFCMVAELKYPLAEMLKEVYADNGIPCTERSVLGAALTVELGVNVGFVRLYVPYARFAEATELRDALFSGEAVLLPDEPGEEE